MHPPLYGPHTSWRSPYKHLPGQLLAEDGQFSRKHLHRSLDAVCAILLVGGCWLAAIGSSGALFRSSLRHGTFLGRRKVAVLLQARLNFVHHAEIGHKLRAARVNHMRLTVGVVVDRDRRQVRELRLAPGKPGRGGKNHKGCSHGNGAICKARRSEPAQPAEHAAPAFRGLARAKCLVQNGVDEMWRRFQGLHRMQIAEQTRNAGNQWRAALASVYVEVKRVLFRRAEKALEIIAESRLGLFASPVHSLLRARSKNLERIMPGALPFAAEYAPVRFARG